MGSESDTRLKSMSLGPGATSTCKPDSNALAYFVGVIRLPEGWGLPVLGGVIFTAETVAMYVPGATKLLEPAARL